MVVINDSPHGICDAASSHVDTRSSTNVGKTSYLDSESSRHLIGYKSLLINFTEKDGPMVTFGDNSRRVVTGVGTFECRTIKLKDIFMLKD